MFATGPAWADYSFARGDGGLPPDLRPTGWFRRALAALVDGAVLWLGLIVGSGPALLLTPLSEEMAGTGLVHGYWVSGLVVLVAQQVLQGRTGGTVGKHLLGAKLVHADTGRPIGVGMSLVRPFVHLLDSIPCYLGYLVPLLDDRRRTFADMVMSTLVVHSPRTRPGLLAPLVAVAVPAVVLVGGVAVVEQSPGLSDVIAELAEEPEPTAGRPLPGSGFSAPGYLEAGQELAPEDLRSRVMPAAREFRAASDDGPGLGPLTVEELAEDDAALAAALREQGVLEAYAAGFAGRSSDYFVTVYRMSSPEAATAFAASSAQGRFVLELGVPDSVAFAGEDEEVAFGVFARGSHVWEVAAAADSGPVDRQLLQRLLLEQRSYAIQVS